MRYNYYGSKSNKFIDGLYEPVLYYPFNGDVLDYSGNGYDASSVGSISYDTNRIGVTNKEVYSPTNTYLKGYWKAPLSNSTKVSFCFWYKHSSNYDGEMIGIYDTTNVKRSWSFGPQSLTKVRFVKSNTGSTGGSGYVVYDMSPVSAVSSWHHYCVQWDVSNNIEIYQDGSLIGSTSTVNDVYNTGYDYFTMGYRIARTGPSAYINGYYSDFLAYNKTLTSVQINDIMTKTSVAHPIP